MALASTDVHRSTRHVCPPRLASKLNESLGPDAAGDLVTWLDEMRADRADVRADFAELRQEMRAMGSRLEENLGGRIHALEVSLRSEIHAVETRLGEKLGDRIHGVETKLGDRLGGLSTEVERSAANLIRWSFVFWVGAVAAIAMLAGVLRT